MPQPDPSTTGASPMRRTVTRVAFHSHLWLGVLFTVVLAVIAVTGILLNHKRALGLMPDVPHTPSGAFDESLPLARLAAIAMDTVRAAGVALPSDDPLRAIDRMDARPRNGFVKVRFRDAASTEVTVDLANGRVLDVGRRGDVYLEKLHSGETFGDGWILLSDAGAIALLVTLVSGYWLWIAPRLSAGSGGHVRRREDASSDREAT
jgi:hypothetical protein